MSVGPDPLMNFDPMAVEPSTGGGNQLPVSGAEGHPVMIIDSRLKPCKDASKGNLLEMDLAIQAPSPQAGQKGIYRLNIGHSDQEVRRIANEQLTSLTRVLGHRTPLAGSHQLYNIPFRVVVDYQKGQQPGQPGAKGYTDVKYVLDINGLSATDPQAGLGGAQTPAPTIAPAPAMAPATPAAVPAMAPATAPVAPAQPPVTAASVPAAPVVSAPQAGIPPQMAQPAAPAAPAAQPAQYTPEQIAAMQAQIGNAMPMQAPASGGQVADPAADPSKPAWMKK